jgi:hypothetical protein
MSSPAYPMDPTGLSPGNKITNEPHVLTEINAAPFRLLIPTFAPFYLDNLALKHVDLLGNETNMIEGVHFTCALPFIGAARSIGKMLYGAFSINDEQLEGNILVTYQTLGGNWCGDAAYVRQFLMEMAYNPKIVVWDQVTNVQETFPPINHQQNLDTIYGMQALIDELARIRDAILAGPSAENGVIKHITDTENPHFTDAEQIGLGLVQNLPVATDAEVNALDPVQKYILLNQALVLLKLQKQPPLLSARELFLMRRN